MRIGEAHSKGATPFGHQDGLIRQISENKSFVDDFYFKCAAEWTSKWVTEDIKKASIAAKPLASLCQATMYNFNDLLFVVTQSV